MDLELAGRRCVVVGGSRGLGLAVAIALVAEGAQLAVMARGYNGLVAAAEEIEAESGQSPAIVPVDTSDSTTVRAGIDAAAGALGGLDVLVNCAAAPATSTSPPTAARVVVDELRGDFDVKVLGYLRTAQAAVGHMIAGGGGRIVNIAGTAARVTGSTSASARNAAVAALTKNLADEWGEHGISAVTVHPARTLTEGSAAVAEETAARTGISRPEAGRRLFGRNLLGRVLTAADVAAAIVMLASPRCWAVNGESIALDGGTPLAIRF